MRDATVIDGTGDERGFSLTDLLVTLAILGILAGIVSNAIGGLGASTRAAVLTGDQTIIDTAVSRFFSESFPNTYPIVALSETDSRIKTQGESSVRVVDFDARLPQDPSKTFVPDFLKEIPDTAAVVSWRIDTRTGRTFFTENGIPLIPPAEPRAKVFSSTTHAGATSDYTLRLIQTKSEAAIEVLTVDLPVGYQFGARTLQPGEIVGTLVGFFSDDNPWDPGRVITFTGSVEATGAANEWALVVHYDTNISSSGKTDVDVKELGPTIPSTRVHKIKIVSPEGASAGQLRIEMDLDSDPLDNEATEIWELTMFGEVEGTPVIVNPASPGVFLWLTKARTTIDVGEVFDGVAIDQAVVIDDAQGVPFSALSKRSSN